MKLEITEKDKYSPQHEKIGKKGTMGTVANKWPQPFTTYNDKTQNHLLFSTLFSTFATPNVFHHRTFNSSMG
jgi:hypothetical protein